MYSIIILPILAGLLCQLVKPLIASNHLKFSFMNITAYSGMPSGHSAMVVALATIIGLEEGFASPIFAIALVLAVLVIRDAVGLRRYLGENGKAINALVKELGQEHLLSKYYPHLLEKVGHTPAQVVVGGTVGLIISYLGYFILG